MNRRTFLTTTPLALAPGTPGRMLSDPIPRDNLNDDSPMLEDLLVTAEELPADWELGHFDTGSPSEWETDPPSTNRGSQSRIHPHTDKRVGSIYAKRRFVTDSELSAEVEHLDLALEVPYMGENAPHDSLREAIQVDHEIALAEETEGWEALNTEWVEVDVSPATDWLCQQSTALFRKPLCMVPEGFDLSTDKPYIEMAVAIVPLPWGTGVVTGTIADPDETGQAHRLATQLANRATSKAHVAPWPAEARE